MYYSYIGMFELCSNRMIITDPYIAGITVAQERISYANEMCIRINNMQNGIYEAYHLVSDDGVVLSLVAIHKDYDKDSLPSLESEYLGFVSSSLGNAICIVDEKFLNHNQSSYYLLIPNAYYSGQKLLECIDKLPYTQEKKELLIELITEKIKSHEEPTGEDLLKIIGGDPLWPGFRDIIESSHWSNEIISRLDYVYTNSITIKGGIASKAPNENLKCYGYKKESQFFCVTVNLINESEPPA